MAQSKELSVGEIVIQDDGDFEIGRVTRLNYSKSGENVTSCQVDVVDAQFHVRSEVWSLLDTRVMTNEEKQKYEIEIGVLRSRN